METSSQNLQWLKTLVPKFEFTSGTLSAAAVSVILFITTKCFNISSDVFSLGTAVVVNGHVHKLLTYSFFHKDLPQLVLGVVALLPFCSSLERSVGTVRFTYILLLLSAWTGLMHVLLELLLFSPADRSRVQGFLPVSLALVGMSTVHSRMTKAMLLGVSVPTPTLPWILLLFTLLIPDTVFLCNAIAILVGATCAPHPLVRTLSRHMPQHLQFPPHRAQMPCLRCMRVGSIPPTPREALLQLCSIMDTAICLALGTVTITALDKDMDTATDTVTVTSRAHGLPSGRWFLDTWGSLWPSPLRSVQSSSCAGCRISLFSSAATWIASGSPGPVTDAQLSLQWILSSIALKQHCTPHILRIPALGHQLLDVVDGLRAGQPTHLLPNLIEGGLDITCHVAGVPGSQTDKTVRTQPRSWMKPMKGAMPVPGPIMITGLLALKGRRNWDFLTYMGTEDLCPLSVTN
ncbi:hypothetical protein JZ751_023167, partial [Albula glossodonta]